MIEDGFPEAIATALASGTVTRAYSESVATWEVEATVGGEALSLRFSYLDVTQGYRWYLAAASENIPEGLWESIQTELARKTPERRAEARAQVARDKEAEKAWMKKMGFSR